MFSRKSIQQAVSKTYRKGRRAAKQRYGTNGGLLRLTEDVMRLKSLVNAEKKRFDLSESAYTMAQLNGNAAGYYSKDVTPIPSQGTTYSGREGSSIKLHSTRVNMQFVQQGTGTDAPIHLIIEMWLIKGVPYASSGTFVTDNWETNPFISTPLIDYNSDLDADNFGRRTLIRSQRVTIPLDSATTSQVVQKTCQFGIIWFKGKGHHIRFQDNSTTIQNGQILMTVRADAGNIGTVSSLTGVPTTTASSGLRMSWNMKHYYFDN